MSEHLKAEVTVILKLLWSVFEECLTLKVPATAIDALQHFETG